MLAVAVALFFQIREAGSTLHQATNVSESGVSAPAAKRGLGPNPSEHANPSQIAAQVEGSVAYGLSATLYGEMPVENGRMTALNFDSYEILRLAEMPKVETVIVPTYDFWGGVGEPTICVVAPAVLNAIFAATGKPMRRLPLKNVKLV